MNARNKRAEELTIDTNSTKQREVEIHGETAKFTLSTGVDKDGKEARVVEGSFKGAGGAAFLYFLGDADAFSEEALIEMLDSMK
jgi:hypothetical protein